MPSLVNLLKDVDVEALSLVPTGANGQRIFLFKCDDFSCPPGANELPAGRIIKADDWSAFYIVVAEPGAEEKPGLYGDPNTVDRWASEDEIRKAAWRFMANGGLVNKLHEDMAPYGQLVENAVSHSDFTVETPNGPHTVRKGSWYVAIAPTDEGRQKIESGELGAVSIQGTGTRSPDDPGMIEPMEKEGWLERIGKALGITEDGCDLVDGCDCHTYVVDEAITDDTIQKAKLNAAGRKALPKTAFAIPSKAPGSGSFPIHDRAHAIAALARSKGKPEEGTVKAQVCKRFKDLPACQPVAKEESLREDGGKLEAPVELADRVEQIEKDVKGLGEKLDASLSDESPLVKSIQDLKIRFEEKASEDEKRAEEEKAADEKPTPESVEKKLDEVAEGQETLAKTLLDLSEQVGTMAESGGSRQVDEREPVKKADAHPLAGLLS